MDGKNKGFQIYGRVVEEKTGKPISNLTVKAIDKDKICDDLLGAVTTNKNGNFVIKYDREDFQELFFDKKPDIYLEIKNREGKPIYSTEESVRYESGKTEEFIIKIPIEEEGNEMKKRTYTVRGHIDFEGGITGKEKLNAKVYARIGRRTLSSAPLDSNDDFEFTFKRKGISLPSALTLVVGPPIPESMLSPANTKHIPISSDEWDISGEEAFIEKNILVEKKYLFCLLPKEIKICGIVCKQLPIEDTDLTRCCPVPFAKVEIFDVDPLILKPVTPPITMIEGIRKIPGIHIPSAPKPAPVRKEEKIVVNKLEAEKIEAHTLKTQLQDYKVENINILDVHNYYSLYSKDKLGEVYTDECGGFCITFLWYPGCYYIPGITNPDISPDLIFKVSQTYYNPTHPDADSSGLVTSTIYSEGYSETRWNVSDYYWVQLDAADDVFVSCNPDCHPLLEKRAFFEGVGSQRIYDDIDQGDDPLKTCGFVYNDPFIKSPFGAILDIKGAFGSKVEDTGERWYRISYAKIPDCNSKPDDDDSTAWTPITDTLVDTCYYWDASEGALHYKDVALGPQSLPGHANPEFYQIRNSQDDDGHDLHWYDHNLIARWKTIEEYDRALKEWTGKIEDGLYVLKIDVFDPDGNPDPSVYIGDDQGKHAYMYLHINNKTPHVEIKKICNGGSPINMDCGAFEHLPGEQVKFLVDACHEDDHLRYWIMTYQIGYGPAKGTVDKKSDGSVWITDPRLEDFHGKECGMPPVCEETNGINWVNFDGDTTNPPAADCPTFGMSIQLAACSKTTNGYSFLASKFGHYKEAHAGLAVHRADQEEEE